MSGIRTPGPIKRAGEAEYARTIAHADGLARCFFCKQWHDTTFEGGPVLLTNTCPARFSRHKTVVITVRHDAGGDRLRPSDEQVQAAVAHCFEHGN